MLGFPLKSSFVYLYVGGASVDTDAHGDGIQSRNPDIMPQEWKYILATSLFHVSSNKTIKSYMYKCKEIGTDGTEGQRTDGLMPNQCV